MASLTVTIISIIWKYSNIILTIGVPVALLICYQYSLIGILYDYEYNGILASICLAALIPVFLVWRWYIYYIRGGNRKCTSTASLKGKTIIITGGNSGIGKGAALDLARRGARVILACRNAQKAQEAINDIQLRSRNENVVFRKLDLSSFKSVREFAERINQEEERLDVLINNAGIPDSNTHDKERNPLPTVDGLSQSFQVNHFGHFLLTNLLLDLLKKNGESRVVNVSSRLHTAPKKLDFRVGDGKVRYPKLTYYTKGKLANVLFTRELSIRMKESGVSSYAVDPGIIFSNIWEKQMAKWKVMVMSLLFWLLFADEESGAQTTVYCAVEEGLKTGEVYFDCRRTTQVNPLVEDEELRKKLWDVSMEVTDLK